jgi:hypothetical protein
MTSQPLTALPISTDISPAPRLCLLGGLDAGELDSMMADGVYALVPQSPPARYPLWARLLQAAVASGQVCHVLLRTDPADFLERLQRSGWPGVHQAWQDEKLRIYPMVDGFSKLLFRRDVQGLTAELSHWGVATGDFLLVDAGDELLSLHDLFLATGQLVKLRAWAKEVKVPMLLNFALAGAGMGQSSLTGLMDHFSGMARLHNDAEGPVLTLEYWQSELGTVAERTVALTAAAGAFQLRPASPVPEADHSTSTHLGAGGSAPDSSEQVSRVMTGSAGNRRATDDRPAATGRFTNDEVWARELQMLTGAHWQSLSNVASVLEATQSLDVSHVVLRFAPQTLLAELARDIHALRVALRTKVRIVVAEHRMSLRYANELMLMRLGADAVIRQDVPLQKWPDLLRRLNTQAPRAFEALDVEQALASVAASHERGYLPLAHFLSEVQTTVERAHVLGVPFAMAVMGQPQGRVSTDWVASVRMRRNGDLLTTDGHQVFVFFYACSLTMGPQVLANAFGQDMPPDPLHIDWMASEADIQGLIHQLTQTLQTLASQPHDTPDNGSDTAGAVDEAEQDTAVTDAQRSALMASDPLSVVVQPASDAMALDGSLVEPVMPPVHAFHVPHLNDTVPFIKPFTETFAGTFTEPSAETSEPFAVAQEESASGEFKELVEPTGAEPALSPVGNDSSADGASNVDGASSDRTASPKHSPPIEVSTVAKAVSAALTVKKEAVRVSEVVPHVPRPSFNPKGLERRNRDREETFVSERRVAELIRRLARPPQSTPSTTAAKPSTPSAPNAGPHDQA